MLSEEMCKEFTTQYRDIRLLECWQTDARQRETSYSSRYIFSRYFVKPSFEKPLAYPTLLSTLRHTLQHHELPDCQDRE